MEQDKLLHTHTNMSMLREFKEDGVPRSIKQKQGSMEEKRDKKKKLLWIKKYDNQNKAKGLSEK